MKRAPLVRTVQVVTSIAVMVALCGCPFDKPEDRLARGKEMAAKQNHAGATIEFKNFLQGRPKSAEGRYWLGRELLAQGDARAAEIELQKAYDAKYDPDAVVPLLVRSQLVLGQPERIPKDFATLQLKSSVANAELRSLIGAGFLMRGKLNEALTAFREAEQFEPDYPAARLGEARIMATKGDLDGASAELATVLEKDPKQFDGLLLKGDIARARGATDDMIAAYQAASVVDPRNLSARLNLTSAYLANNAPDPAAKELVELKKLAPRDPAVNYLDALISYNKKDYLHANDAITLSLDANGASGAAQLLSGAISVAINQPAQAEIHLLEGIRLVPNSIFGRRLLTSLYLRQRQPQKANEVLLPAMRLLPSDPDILALAGDVALQLGDYNNASKFFAKATQIDPDNTDVRVRAANAELARGDDAAGFAALESAAKASSNNPSPDIALVVAHLTRHQYDQALAAWANLEKQQPDSPVTYNLRATIALGLDDRPGARKALEHALQIQPTFVPVVVNLAFLDEQDGDIDAARDRYKTLLKKDKGNVSGLIGLAQLEARHGGKSDVVVPLLVEARRISPTSEQPRTALIAYYVSQNDVKDALATAQDALSGSPNNENYLNLVGGLQLQTGGVDQAIAAFRQLVALRPGQIDYQIRLGQAMVFANQADMALTVFGGVLKAQPDNVAAQSAMVDTLLAAGKVNEATRLVGEIRKTSAKSTVLTELDGDLKAAAKQYADASVIFRKALVQNPSSGLAMKLCRALQAAGNEAAGRVALADWLKTHPQDTPVRVFDADVALRAHDYAHAVESYREVLKARPDDPVLMNNLAWALWQQKDPSALGYAQKANGIAPNLAAVNDTLGTIMVEQGQVRDGIAFLEKASAAAPSQRAIALHLAQAQIKDGRKDAARTTLQGIVKAAPESEEGKESKMLMTKL